MVGMTETSPHSFLDDIDGTDALAWVEAHNQRTMEVLGTDRLEQLTSDIETILTNPDRIAGVHVRGEWAWNFWTDAEHPRGLWRRQLLTSYLTGGTDWDIILDVDALAASEGRSWVWHGATLCPPEFSRALITLSDGGSDTSEIREFDVETGCFVEDGFTVPACKGDAAWISPNEVWVCADFGEGTLTDSGYPRQARRWRRGTPMSEAHVVYECQPSDVLTMASRDHTPGFERDAIVRAITMDESQLFLADVPGDSDTDGSTSLRLVDAPQTVNVGVWRNWLIFRPLVDWVEGEVNVPAGAVAVADLESFMAGGREVRVIFAPDATSSVESMTVTRSHLVLTTLTNVSSRIRIVTPPVEAGGEWAACDLDLASVDAIPEFPMIDVSAVDPHDSNDLWLTVTGFTTPTTLLHISLDDAANVTATVSVQSSPEFFDAANVTVSQHWATSADGTRVPYFEISPTNAPSPRPTLLYGYGGFDVSLTPYYLAVPGRAWIERGGSYVVANIRGGGEFGPAWHQAALMNNRHRAYEDFAAVARDLVARGVTTADQLGAQGGSNGGLLMGMMLTAYPEDFGAIVCQVPLLDMRRYHRLLAGASWMCEYGNPDDPEQWEFICTFSPYHLFDAERAYPPVFFTTSTKDDRVHPAHARTMMARCDEAGKDALYFENIEGGHAGAADSRQRARMAALAWEFLLQRLADR